MNTGVQEKMQSVLGDGEGQVFSYDMNKEKIKKYPTYAKSYSEH